MTFSLARLLDGENRRHSRYPYSIAQFNLIANGTEVPVRAKVTDTKRSADQYFALVNFCQKKKTVEGLDRELALEIMVADRPLSSRSPGKAEVAVPSQIADSWELALLTRTFKYHHTPAPATRTYAKVPKTGPGCPSCRAKPM